MARIGPVIFAVEGDSYLDGASINAIVWVGSTTAGDEVILTDRLTLDVLWRGRASGTHTYLGANLGNTGIHAPNGFVASRLDSGELLVYLRED